MTNKIKEIIKQARKEKRTFLLEPESKTIINELKLTTTNFEIATTEKEAVKIAKKIGYPVVMKIISPQIVHKTDAGGVKLNLTTEKAIISAYKEIVKNTAKYNQKAEIRGILVEKMVEPTTEIIIGVTRDPTFGPAIMFGLGGIFVELLKDVSFRIAPLEKKDAKQMIQEIKALPMLQGFRGGPNVKLDLIEDALMKISAFVVEYIDDVLEIDLNPIFAYDEKLLTVDARIILTEK